MIPNDSRKCAQRVLRQLSMAYQTHSRDLNPFLLEQEIGEAWQSLDALHNTLGDAPAIEEAKKHLAAYEDFLSMLCRTLNHKEDTR